MTNVAECCIWTLCVSCWHQRMSIKDRSENSVAGFVLVDLFKLLSRITAARARIPHTACFLAPQTKENLQHATCLTAMTICYTKATQGDYWRSANRVSEISIEEFFGRLHTQAYARGCWRTMLGKRGDNRQPISQKSIPSRNCLP